jgi:hypothetical protein
MHLVRRILLSPDLHFLQTPFTLVLLLCTLCAVLDRAQSHQTMASLRAFPDTVRHCHLAGHLSEHAPMPIEPEHPSSAFPTEPLSDRFKSAPIGERVLQSWQSSSFVLAEDWQQLPASVQSELNRCSEPNVLVDKLVEHKLLTEFQASRIKSGKTFGLVLGNFRVLERLGAGGMGVVYKAEHITMRRLAAIKVLASFGVEDPQMLLRFRAEMRAVAQLNHPNIVSAFDAGTIDNPDPDGPTLHYFVMEYVPGQDLHDWVTSEGPLRIVQGCDVAYQVASALAEAHKHQLVHRDVKPANIQITPERQGKLLDFGLALHHRRRMTEPGAVLGTIDYIAPEQVSDSSAVDIRADIYGLGGSLF